MPNRKIGIGLVLLLVVGLCIGTGLFVMGGDRLVSESQEMQEASESQEMQEASESQESRASQATQESRVAADQAPTLPYGVFLSIDATDLQRLYPYRVVVIDAQSFTEADIATLHARGMTVYSYLNIGSLENFRSDYKTYKHLTLGPYLNWPEEEWVDVGDPAWQAHVLSLGAEYAAMGIDGYFIDNCDVYDQFQQDDIFMGLTAVLRSLKTSGKPVIINGGDTYVKAYDRRFGQVTDILTGINQESVFSTIDFEHHTLGIQDRENQAYFQDYIEAYAAKGCRIYLMEYTRDPKFMATIQAYADKMGFEVYFSDSIELD